MTSVGRPEDLETKIARLLMTRAAGHEVATRLKENEAGWQDRAAMADLRARRAELQRDHAPDMQDNVYVLNIPGQRRAVG